MAFNIVELATANSENCAFDQRCRFGHRVEDHAVYCRNDNWDDSPRKCRRSWYKVQAQTPSSYRATTTHPEEIIVPLSKSSSPAD